MMPTYRGRVPSFTDRIESVKRLQNSVNGNPRFVVTFRSGHVYQTQSDSSVSYDVENYSRGNVDTNPELAVWLTRGGRIEVLEKL